MKRVPPYFRRWLPVAVLPLVILASFLFFTHIDNQPTAKPSAEQQATESIQSDVGQSIESGSSIPQELQQLDNTQPNEATLYQVNAQTPLFADPNTYLGSNPWSPDGQAVLLNKFTGKETNRIVDPKTKQLFARGIAELWKYSFASGTLSKLADNGNRATWSNDGKEIFYSVYLPDGRTEEVRRANADGTGVTFLNTGTAPQTTYLANKTVVLVRDNRIFVRDSTGQERQWPAVVVPDDLIGTSVSVIPAPDTSAVVVVNHETVELFRANGDQMRLVQDFRRGFSSLSWSPDSRQLVYLTARPKAEVRIIDFKQMTIRIVWTSPNPNEDFLSPAWSTNGKQLALIRQIWRSSVPASLWILDIQQGLTQKVLDSVLMAAWSPQGNQLIYRAADSAGTFGLIQLQ